MRSMTDEGRRGLVAFLPRALIRPLLRKGHLLPPVGEGCAAPVFDKQKSKCASFSRLRENAASLAD